MTEYSAEGDELPTASQGGFGLGTFLAALVAGLFIMIVFQQRLATAITLLVLVIVGYGVAGYRSSPGKEAKEAHGDSVYYLGFCLTLASLAIGLVFREEGGDGTKALINTFGYGLIVTACGLVLRIIIQSLAGDSAVNAQQTPDEVAGSFRRIGEGIQDAADDLAQTQVEFKTRSLAIVGDLISIAGEIRAHLQSEVQRDTVGALEAIRQATDGALDAIRQVSEQAVLGIQESHQRVHAASESAAKSIAEAGEVIKQSAADFKDGASSIKRTAKSMGGTAEAMDEISETVSSGLGKLKSGVDSVTSSLTKVEELVRELSEFQNSLVRMNASTVQISADMAQLRRTIHEVAEATATAQRDAASATEQVGKTLDTLLRRNWS